MKEKVVLEMPSENRQCQGKGNMGGQLIPDSSCLCALMPPNEQPCLVNLNMPTMIIKCCHSLAQQTGRVGLACQTGPGYLV